VVTIDAQYRETGEAFLVYSWKHFKYIPLGERCIDIWSRYIKPKGRYGAVAHECSSKHMLFLHGWRPILVTKDKESDGSYRAGTKIHFIRKTFSINKLMADVANDYDNENHTIHENVNNFEVKRFFGQLSTENQRQFNPYLKGLMSASSCRPIHYTKEELGSPTQPDPFKHLFYNEEVEQFRHELVKWKDSKDWYSSKGLKWRFGVGLYGMPGTGKTSFVRACAQEMNIPIHIYDLTTMCNEELTKFWGQSLSVAPCAVLFEDVDRIFDENKKVMGAINKPPLTLDCLLNLINGVEPSDGIVVFVTANDMSKIDSALGRLDENGKSTRPGRLDRIIILGPLEESARRKIARKMLGHLSPELMEIIVKEGEGETGAQFENRCATIALEVYWGRKDIASFQEEKPEEIIEGSVEEHGKKLRSHD
jgi:hypothetical protein